MSEENLENITKSDNNVAPTFLDHHLLPDMSFSGHGLIKNHFYPWKFINLYVSYTLRPQLTKWNTDFTLGNCFFGSVKLTKNAEPSKYNFTDCRIAFDSRSEFLFTDRRYGKNEFIFRTVYTKMEAAVFFLLMLQGIFPK